jgi:hypothetical protein
MGSGSKFCDPVNPAVVVKVGDSGSSGVLEITDMVFKTKGPGMACLLSLLVKFTAMHYSWWRHCRGMERP